MNCTDKTDAKTKIVISLDTEDFTQNHAADAIKMLADLFTGEGVRANFCLVGLLASQLEAWGRRDVLDALKNHEIGSHTYGHSLHPMIDEYTDIADFAAAEAECLRQEGEAVRLIRRATGAEKINAAVAPGNAKSYVAMYTYPKLGIPIYGDTVCDTADGRGVFYCNVYNMSYTQSFEGLFFAKDGFDTDEVLDRLAARKKAILYTHPNYLLYTDWWDILNYDKENTYPFGQWVEGRRRDPAQTEYYLSQLRLLLRRIKADPRFEIVTYADIVRSEGIGRTRRLFRSDIPAIKAALDADFAPLTLRGDGYCLSDIFHACRAFLDGKDCFDAGYVYGFLDEPRGIAAPADFTAADIRRAAAAINPGDFLPASLKVGDTAAGAADLLYAMLGLLAAGNADGCVIHAQPRAQHNSTACLPSLAGFSTRGTWRHCADFRDEFQSRRMKLQGWTMRF